MINDKALRNRQRVRRSFRVRKHVRGTAVKPRLSVFKSNQHLFAQLIDDEAGVTLVSSGTMVKALREKDFSRKSKGAAREIGLLLAKAAQEKGIQKVVFDRGHYKYHGLLAEIANAARETGLQF